MNEAHLHIREQADLIANLPDTTKQTDKAYHRGILEGLCIAYFKLGQITEDEWRWVTLRSVAKPSN